MRTETSTLGVKTLIIKILILLSLISFSGINFIWNTYATDEESKWIKVTVTEKIPWANCEEKWKAEDGETQMYECTVKKWFWSVIEMLWKIIKYFTYIAALAWVLFIVVNGIMYSMWWADDSFKTESKKRIIATLIWLAVLMLSWVILNAIAPWIYVWW